MFTMRRARAIKRQGNVKCNVCRKIKIKAGSTDQKFVHIVHRLEVEAGESQIGPPWKEVGGVEAGGSTTFITCT